MPRLPGGHVVKEAPGALGKQRPEEALWDAWTAGLTPKEYVPCVLTLDTSRLL